MKECRALFYIYVYLKSLKHRACDVSNLVTSVWIMLELFPPGCL